MGVSAGENGGGGSLDFMSRKRGRPPKIMAGRRVTCFCVIEPPATEQTHASHQPF